MTPFDDDELEALRQLKAVWQNSRCCLIGASALRCHFDQYWRETRDLDVTVAVSQDRVIPTIRSLSGWSQSPKQEHRWRTPSGLLVDILPADPEGQQCEYLTWPSSGQKMSLVGFHLVFEHSRPFRMADDLDFLVAPLSVVAFLKIVAYLDRPWERARDLEDLGRILEDYLSPDDDQRFSDTVLTAGVSYQASSALVLGSDLGRMLTMREMAIVKQWIARIRDPRDPLLTEPRLLLSGPPAWQNRPEELLERIDALELGLSFA
jgi:predicted nucleotidyltransferase